MTLWILSTPQLKSEDLYFRYSDYWRLKKFSYLLQHHSDHFVYIWDARSKLATLCTSFLTFPCFNPCLDQTDIKNSVLKGDYAFQEYSVLNWIHHTNIIWSHGKIPRDIDTVRLGRSILALYRHYLEQIPMLTSGLSNGAVGTYEASVSTALNVCQDANDLVDDVRLGQADPGKLSYFTMVLSILILKLLPNQSLIF